MLYSKRTGTPDMSAIKNQIGASLLEVMISFFVLGVGLLGVLALQSKSLRYNQQAYSYSQAVFLANDIVENIRINKDFAEQYEVEESSSLASNNSCQGIDANCTAEQIKDWDISNWLNDISSRLPGGKGAIDYQDGVVTVKITFNIVNLNEDGNEQTELPDHERQEYVLYTTI